MILRMRLNRHLLGAIWLPFSRNVHDKPITNHVKVPETTGIERVKNIFKKDEFGVVNYKLTNILQTSYMGLFIGFLVGGIIQTQNAFVNFMHNNQASGFETPQAARKSLQDDMVRSFLKGGGTFSLKVGVFLTSFIFVLTLSIEYRNKETPLEYTASGIVSGALWRIAYGIRGMISGACIGGCLGLIFGSIIYIVEYLTDHSFEKFTLWSMKIHKMRDSSFSKNYLAERDKIDKDYPVLYAHNMESQKLEKEINLETIE